MCAVLFYLFFPINIYLSLSVQPSLFIVDSVGGGGGSMTGQILGQAVAVTGAPSDVFDDYSSTQTQRP